MHAGHSPQKASKVATPAAQRSIRVCVITLMLQSAANCGLIIVGVYLEEPSDSPRYSAKSAYSKIGWICHVTAANVAILVMVLYGPHGLATWMADHAQVSRKVHGPAFSVLKQSTPPLYQMIVSSLQMKSYRG